MSLEKGAETIVHQCLAVKPGETVVVVNDGNDHDLIDALLEVLEENGNSPEYIEYEEPENHGEEPPGNVAEAMKQADIFIAPTLKSISHTRARVEACKSGSRGATLPGITREIWESSLQTDYGEVEELSEKVYQMLENTDEVRIETPSGTDLTLGIDIQYFHTDTGIIQQPGEFGNLPAGEADGFPVDANGTLAVDHLPPARDAEGSRIEISDGKVVAVKSEKENGLERKFGSIEGARKVAEFGFGTNPAATIIGNVLQDEKVLGTVHVAFGDNSSYVPEGDGKRVESGIHWDIICLKPTVRFDDRLVLENGNPVFRD